MVAQPKAVYVVRSFTPRGQARRPKTIQKSQGCTRNAIAVPVIVYELNEVPWKVLDEHVKRHPDGAFAHVLEYGATFTTVAADSGHLSPWVTWPSLHRGVANDDHGIQDLGQDVSTFRYKPIWEIVRDHGLAVGVFGSLQSWPPRDPGDRGFYVPDPFAPNSRCLPKNLEPFQRFNLRNSRRSGRVVGRADPSSLLDVPNLIRIGVKPRSLIALARQLAREVKEPTMRHRRPAFQGILGFDVFERAWRKRKPAFSTFFTNHVAGFMHRYWRAAFPEDFDGELPDERAYAGAIQWGMEVADRQLGRMLQMAPNALVLVASSMGQAAIQPRRQSQSVQLARVRDLAEAIGWAGSYQPRPAMEPQIALEVVDADDRQMLRELLASCTDSSGAPVFSANENGASVSITTHATNALVSDRQVKGPGGAFRKAAAFGLEVFDVETPGTAYHVPEGILLAYGPGVAPNAGRTLISALEVAPAVLNVLGVTPPDYMQKSVVLAEAFASVEPAIGCAK